MLYLNQPKLTGRNTIFKREKNIVQNFVFNWARNATVQGIAGGSSAMSNKAETVKNAATRAWIPVRICIRMGEMEVQTDAE